MLQNKSGLLTSEQLQNEIPVRKLLSRPGVLEYFIEIFGWGKFYPKKVIQKNIGETGDTYETYSTSFYIIHFSTWLNIIIFNNQTIKDNQNINMQTRIDSNNFIDEQKLTD